MSVRRIHCEYLNTFIDIPERPRRGTSGLRAPATLQRGRNLIHDGPSILDTARWLRTQLFS